jgi:diguanylate cyclase (GGDEF)-like protein
MMNGEECLGVIGLASSEGLPTHGEVVLETIVEFGALALHQASEIDQIRSVADVDWLTGILNKGAVVSRLEALLAQAMKRREALALFLFDIDHFKHYNDTHGHLAGDDLLRLLARSVKEHTRRDDVFGRFGGDEFLLVFPGRDLDTAIRGGTNVLQVVRDLAFPFGESQPLGRITVSGGVACFSGGVCSSTDILFRADEALYQAKRSGRDQVVAAAAPVDKALKLSSV